MISKVRRNRQDIRTWAIEQLIRKENFLDPRMYACADCYASMYISQVLDDLYTLWMEWKEKHPTDNPQVINRL
tara:strand:+ start:1251 stop:1469 length:219 start_codon:yes stop_codon:yes gene_type:complete